MIKDIHKIYNFPKPEIADDQTVYTSYTMKSSIKDGIGHGAYGDVYRVMHIKTGLLSSKFQIMETTETGFQQSQ